MASLPWRGLVPPLLWGLSLFLSLPGPIWLQPSPPPQASPPTELHPCHTCRGLVDSFNKVGAPAALWDGRWPNHDSTEVERSPGMQVCMSQVPAWLLTSCMTLGRLPLCAPVPWSVKYRSAGMCQALYLAITNVLHFQGLERTIRDNFGGGNTAWEEEKLSKYKDR